MRYNINKEVNIYGREFPRHSWQTKMIFEGVASFRDGIWTLSEICGIGSDAFENGEIAITWQKSELKSGYYNLTLTIEVNSVERDDGDCDFEYDMSKQTKVIEKHLEHIWLDFDKNDKNIIAKIVEKDNKGRIEI